MNLISQIMNIYNLFKLLIILVCVNNSYSQTGPGGVEQTNASALELWLKSDKGVYEDTGTDLAESGDAVNQWNDNSGYNRHIQQTILTQQPIYTTNTLNGQPVLTFSGDDNLGPLSINIFSNNYSIFMVSYTGGDKTDFLSFSYPNPDTSNPISLFGILLEGTSSNGLRFLHRNPIAVSGGNSLNAGNARSTTTSQILSFTRGTPATGLQQFWINGSNNQFITAINPNLASGSGNLLLGKLSPTQDERYLNGVMTEVIIISKEVNTAERIIIENYLSAKYNLALAANDLYTQDNAGAGNFDHKVAGIGQASDGSNHTDSRGSGIVRINTPSDLQNNEYLFWGEETKNPTYNFTTNALNYTEQLSSKWRVSKTGDIGTVTVDVDMTGINISGKTPCADLKLMVDNDSNFSSPTKTYTLVNVSGNIYRATGVSFLNNDYFTINYFDEIVWDGGTNRFFNGSGTAFAPNNTNSCYKFTVKSGTAVNLNTNAHVREVKVETGATLNIADGVLLEIENQVVVNGTIDLLGEAQLIQNHAGTTLNSGTGNLKTQQQGTPNLYNYNYLSSPVNRSGNWQIGYLEDTAGTINFTTAINADPTTTPITLSSRWLYGFNGSSGDYNSWAKLSTTTNLSPGVGFTMKGSGAGTPDQEYIFKGIPNDGEYTFPVTANTDLLLGNPYPSTLDADQFILDNSSIIDGSLYFWESFSTNNSHYLADYEGGYAVYNLLGTPTPAVAGNGGNASNLGYPSKPAPTQYINIGQGFFTTITNPGTLTFNNAQRAFARESLGETIFYKTHNTKNKATIDERPKVWLSFTSPKKYSKIIGLGYDSKNATYGYDRGYDAKSFDNLKNDFYWLLDDEPLVIQALPEINIQDDLPLGIKISDAGLYKFSIDKVKNIPDNLNIYLLDKNENAYYNLRQGDAQLFLKTGTFNKFSIVFKKDNALATKPFDDKNVFVSYNSSTKLLELHTNQPITDIENFKIYNTLGQELMNINNPTSKSINVSNLQNSIYFLKVNTKTIKNSKGIKFVRY